MLRRVLEIAALLAVAGIGSGMTVDGNGSISWSFLPGAWDGNYSATGVPKHLAPALPLAADLLDRVQALLPERQNVPKRHPELQGDDDEANPRLLVDASVRITFVHEGARDRNAFGFFAWRDEAVPEARSQVDETVVFPYVRAARGAADPKGLHPGDTVDLGRFPAGTRLGFFVAADGFDPVHGVNPRQNPARVFYTLRALNPERNADRRTHAVVLNDAATGAVIVGLEDSLRDGKGDEDFNDVVFAVTTDPAGAFDAPRIRPLPAAVAPVSPGPASPPSGTRSPW